MRRGVLCHLPMSGQYVRNWRFCAMATSGPMHSFPRRQTPIRLRSNRKTVHAFVCSSGNRWRNRATLGDDYLVLRIDDIHLAMIAVGEVSRRLEKGAVDRSPLTMRRPEDVGLPTGIKSHHAGRTSCSRILTQDAPGKPWGGSVRKVEVRGAAI